MEAEGREFVGAKVLTALNLYAHWLLGWSKGGHWSQHQLRYNTGPLGGGGAGVVVVGGAVVVVVMIMVMVVGMLKGLGGRMSPWGTRGCFEGKRHVHFSLIWLLGLLHLHRGPWSPVGSSLEAPLVP